MPNSPRNLSSNLLWTRHAILWITVFIIQNYNRIWSSWSGNELKLTGTFVMNYAGSAMLYADVARAKLNVQG